MWFSSLFWHLAYLVWFLLSVNTFKTGQAGCVQSRPVPNRYRVALYRSALYRFGTEPLMKINELCAISWQWLWIRVDVPVAHWLRIRADNLYLFNDLSASIIRSSVCHRRSCGMSTRICSLSRGKWLRIRVDVLTIRLPVFVAHGLKIRSDVPEVRLPVSIAHVLQIRANKRS